MKYTKSKEPKTKTNKPLEMIREALAQIKLFSYKTKAIKNKTNWVALQN